MADPLHSAWNQTARQGEELDLSQLAAFLRERLPDLPPEVPDLAVTQFLDGYSNLTYRVQAGTHDMVLRRPPHGAHIRAGHDMGREFRVLSALLPVYPLIPKPLWYCDDPSVLGAPFYLMERVDGTILRRPLTLKPAAEIMQPLALQVIANLATIHGLDWHQGELAQLGRPAGYTQRQVTGWLERYQQAKTDDLATLDRVGQWLSEHIPTTTDAALIHNDYKYDNMVLDAADLTRIVAVLDWEMSTLGDPLTDLGTTLAYWIDPDDPPALRALSPNGPITTLPGNPTRTAVAERYATVSGRDLGDLVFYYAFGVYKNAVIAQQIYTRYRQGLTTDERFGQLIHSIRQMAEHAARAIERQRIDQLS